MWFEGRDWRGIHRAGAARSKSCICNKHDQVCIALQLRLVDVPLLLERSVLESAF
jgi:hypothetical protein